MASLTTVYVISIILTSLAGIGSAFVGNKIYPLKGGAVELPPTPAEVEKATAEADKAASAAALKASKLAAADAYNIKKAQEAQEVPVPEVPVPEVPTASNETDTLKNAIKTGFNMDDEFAANVVDFIKTPVIEWASLASSPQELRNKFRKTLTHPNLNKCPAKLLDLCKIVNIKYSNMKDFIENNPYTPYGDQTKDAIALLSSTE